MSKNVQDRGDTNVNTVVFESIQSLYEDMLSNQSFIRGENKYNGNEAILEGCSIYRHVELKSGKLNFHGNKFGGSELVIKGEILLMQKTDNLDACICEYQFIIKGLKEPLILMAYKKSQR